MRAKHPKGCAQPGGGVVSHGLTNQKKWCPQRKAEAQLLEQREIDALEPKKKTSTNCLKSSFVALKKFTDLCISFSNWSVRQHLILYLPMSLDKHMSATCIILKH